MGLGMCTWKAEFVLIRKRKLPIYLPSSLEPFAECSPLVIIMLSSDVLDMLTGFPSLVKVRLG